MCYLLFIHKVIRLLNGDSFFKKWVKQCLILSNNIKSSTDILELCDNNIVEELMIAFGKPDCPIKSK